MSVTIDHEMLSTDDLGLKTIGQVLSHVHTRNRLVVNLLVDLSYGVLNPRIRLSK